MSDAQLPNPKRLCDEYLDIPSRPWAATYCKLPDGHDGGHSAHYPAEVAAPSTKEKPDA